MNADYIMDQIKKALMEHHSVEVEFYGSRSTRERDDGKLVIQCQNGREVTESHPQADFHQEKFVVEQDFDVLVSKDGTVHEIRERDTDSGYETDRIEIT